MVQKNSMAAILFTSKLKNPLSQRLRHFLSPFLHERGPPLRRAMVPSARTPGGKQSLGCKLVRVSPRHTRPTTFTILIALWEPTQIKGPGRVVPADGIPIRSYLHMYETDAFAGRVSLFLSQPLPGRSSRGGAVRSWRPELACAPCKPAAGQWIAT